MVSEQWKRTYWGDSLLLKLLHFVSAEDHSISEGPEMTWLVDQAALQLSQACIQGSFNSFCLKVLEENSYSKWYIWYWRLPSRPSKSKRTGKRRACCEPPRQVPPGIAERRCSSRILRSIDCGYSGYRGQWLALEREKGLGVRRVRLAPARRVEAVVHATTRESHDTTSRYAGVLLSAPMMSGTTWTVSNLY